MSKNYAIIHMIVDPKVKERLKEIAEQEGIPQTQVVVRLINKTKLKKEDK